MADLKPCPFCGGEAELDTRQGYSQFPGGQRGTRIAVFCCDCGADIGICREDVPSVEPEYVVELWNRRNAGVDVPSNPPEAAPAANTKPASEPVQADDPKAVQQLHLTPPMVNTAINGDAIVRAALAAIAGQRPSSFIKLLAAGVDVPQGQEKDRG